ncbi:hypothetical protein GCM10009838_22790 [Catenulispora subtropica]|uniref:Uncharacterized protein n=1 Tax=Catenulispora subtropica TaxID=450798 RepID=A0ABN2R7W7_9ACTN
MDQVADDLDLHAEHQGLGLDLRDLRLGAVDQHDPIVLVAGIAVLGLVERGRHDVGDVSATDPVSRLLPP